MVVTEGQTYINVHTANNGPGEIRGQVVPSPIIFADGFESGMRVKHLLAVVGLLALPQIGGAMCVATTENLVRVEVLACQRVKIDASPSRPPAHAIHARGSSISGALISGRVVESELVWLGDERMAEYTIEGSKAPLDESSTFFLPGNAAKVCPALVGREKTFVTGRPCCDLLPGSGLCLVPGSMPVVNEEKRPQRWQRWPPKPK